jgi:hypothetical protein
MSEIEHFLRTEITHCRERVVDFPSPFYDGVKVGYKESKKLNDKHISFCQHLLNLIENDNEEVSK